MKKIILYALALLILTGCKINIEKPLYTLTFRERLQEEFSKYSITTIENPIYSEVFIYDNIYTMFNFYFGISKDTLHPILIIFDEQRGQGIYSKIRNIYVNNQCNKIYDIESKSNNFLEIIYLNNEQETEIIVEVIYSDGSNMRKAFNIDIAKYKFYLGF